MSDVNNPFTILFDQNTNLLTVKFKTKSDCNAFGQWDFFSKLLYQLSPNENGEWVVASTGRLDAYIVGFPPDVAWRRSSDKEFQAIISSHDDLDSYKNELESSVKGLMGESPEDSLMRKTYDFSIRQGGEETHYSFLGRAREVNAFCVLWDLESHPRNHLEVISKIKPQNKYPPRPEQARASRLYGDPSKTVDELRNQGFPRESDLQEGEDKPSLKIERKVFQGTAQEHYQLLTRIQRKEFQVGRSQIPAAIRKKLYQHFEHKCNICHQTLPDIYLAPDHRVPAIVRADELNRSNYLGKLQTLCRACNQVKREVCKRCPFNKQCEKCPWAYPEKHSLSPASLNRLHSLALASEISIDDLVEMACDYIEEQL